jgi:hypothetical protein
VVTKIIGLKKCKYDQIWKIWKILPIFRNHKIEKENFGVDLFVHNWSTLASILPSRTLGAQAHEENTTLGKWGKIIEGQHGPKKPSFSTNSFDKVFIYGSHLRKNMTIGKEI